jgi:two-component system, response regulator FlrC
MRAGGGKILVVEDDGVERESLVELLQLWGYEVRAASDGWEALEKIASAPFDVIVSDAQMPRMNGIGLLCELQRSFRLISCVMISGQDNKLEELVALRLGARSFLRKPIDPEQLKSELTKCFREGYRNQSTGAALQRAPQPSRNGRETSG